MIFERSYHESPLRSERDIPRDTTIYFKDLKPQWKDAIGYYYSDTFLVTEVPLKARIRKTPISASLLDEFDQYKHQLNDTYLVRKESLKEGWTLEYFMSYAPSLKMLKERRSMKHTPGRVPRLYDGSIYYYDLQGTIKCIAHYENGVLIKLYTSVTTEKLRAADSEEDDDNPFPEEPCNTYVYEEDIYQRSSFKGHEELDVFKYLYTRYIVEIDCSDALDGLDNGDNTPKETDNPYTHPGNEEPREGGIGPGGGDSEGGIPAPMMKIEETDSFRLASNGRYKCLLDKLMKSSKLAQRISERFNRKSSPGHLYFETERLPNNSRYGNSSIPIPGERYLIKVTLNLAQLDKAHNLKVVGTLIHEMIHAQLYWYIYSLTEKNEGLINITWEELANNFPVLYDYYQKYNKDNSNASHSFMADHYIEIIKEVLQEFNNTYYNYPLSEEELEAYAWSGLNRTSAWEQLPQEKKNKISAIIDSWGKTQYSNDEKKCE